MQCNAQKNKLKLIAITTITATQRIRPIIARLAHDNGCDCGGE